MDFLKKIFNSKKVKDTEKNIKKTTKNVLEKVDDFVEDVDKKIESSETITNIKESVSETFDDIKDGFSKFDNKTGITKKIKKGTEKVEEVFDETKEKVTAYLDEKITFDDFVKIEIKIGEILEAEKVEKSDKLLKLKVQFGREKRQIISGIAKDYKADELIGKKASFVTNLLPRKIFGLESDGMILGVSDKENGFSILSPQKDIKSGSKAS